MTHLNLIGTTLGRFTILAEVGRGGMAVVYKARQVDLDREVALKVLSPALSHDHSFIDRFWQEARSAARLEHPNIVPIYDIDVVDNLHYIAMKFIAGKTLQDLLEETGGLNVHQALEILRPVGAALSYAHRRNFIHRDIKPNNIMISDDGWVYLADFGLARDVSSTAGMTQAGTVMGTPEYMSPEQAQGLPNVGPATDIYALGVVLYEALSGASPFLADTPMGMLAARLLEEPRPLRAARSDLPPAVEAVVMRALARNPADRFSSVDAMMTALQQAASAIAPARTTTPAPAPSPAAPARERPSIPPFVLPKSPPPAMRRPRVDAARAPVPAQPQHRMHPTRPARDQRELPRCPACNSLNPADAVFCVKCGRSLTGDVQQPTRATPAPKPQPAPIPPIPTVPPVAPQKQRRHKHHHPIFWSGIGTVFFLLGLAVLAITRFWWPGILLLIGTTSLLSSIAAGRAWAGVNSAVFMFGLSVLAVTRLWWPGILVLMAIMALLNGFHHRGRTGW